MIHIFGYIVCNKNGLEKVETERYRAFYCGLCKSLKQHFGQLERMSLSYDMTFLALFLTALYEPQEISHNFHCPIHPVKTKEYIENKYIDYAAHMTIALTYYKCMDDWEDEHKALSYKLAGKLKKSYDHVAEEYPRQCKCIEEHIRLLTEIEKSSDAIPDEAINCSGRMLSEVFVMEEDFWSTNLRKFGYELGRFIYLMDASMDYEADKKHGSYNPLVKLGKTPKESQEILTGAISNAAREFERLPILQDDRLLRNILYSGVWQQYYARFMTKEKNRNK